MKRFLLILALSAGIIIALTLISKPIVYTEHILTRSDYEDIAYKARSYFSDHNTTEFQNIDEVRYLESHLDEDERYIAKSSHLEFIQPKEPRLLMHDIDRNVCIAIADKNKEFSCFRRTTTDDTYKYSLSFRLIPFSLNS